MPGWLVAIPDRAGALDGEAKNSRVAASRPAWPRRDAVQRLLTGRLGLKVIQKRVRFRARRQSDGGKSARGAASNHSRAIAEVLKQRRTAASAPARQAFPVDVSKLRLAGGVQRRPLKKSPGVSPGTILIGVVGREQDAVDPDDLDAPLQYGRPPATLGKLMA
jgi:hypothetical protein